MLRIQLDDHAIFLTRWRDFLVQLIDDDSVRDHPRRVNSRSSSRLAGTRLRRFVAYRLVRGYHSRAELAVWEMIARAMKIPPKDSPILPSQFERPCGSWCTSSRCICSPRTTQLA